jgi:hypothetical protein
MSHDVHFWFVVSPSYDWVVEATDIIEAVPLFIYERTLEIDGQHVTVFEVGSRPTLFRMNNTNHWLSDSMLLVGGPRWIGIYCSWPCRLLGTEYQ